MNCREANKVLEDMFSRQIVSSVEIGMQEDLDCKGEAYHNEFAKELDYEMKKKLRFTFSTGYALQITRCCRIASKT